jgi:hypothetical protein
VVTDHVPAGQQGLAAGTEAAQIVGGRQVGLFQVAGGLGGGQRQVPELGGEFVGQFLAQGRDAGPQQRDRLWPGQHVDLQPPPRAPQPGLREVISACPGPPGR